MVDAVPLFSDGAQPGSSTLIRHAVDEGDFGRVRELSDQVFRMSGVVVRGDQRGREMGFPTANIDLAPGLAVPADGVYAGWVTRLDDPDAPRWPAAISVGTNPTFDGVERRVEAYVLDRDDLELYGVEIAIDFYARLRGQVKYRGMEALIEQMHADVEQVRHILLHCRRDGSASLATATSVCRPARSTRSVVEAAGSRDLGVRHAAAAAASRSAVPRSSPRSSAVSSPPR